MSWTGNRPPRATLRNASCTAPTSSVSEYGAGGAPGTLGTGATGSSSTTTSPAAIPANAGIG
jgi:hypothetical protein